MDMISSLRIKAIMIAPAIMALMSDAASENEDASKKLSLNVDLPDSTGSCRLNPGLQTPKNGRSHAVETSRFDEDRLEGALEDHDSPDWLIKHLRRVGSKVNSGAPMPIHTKAPQNTPAKPKPVQTQPPDDEKSGKEDQEKNKGKVYRAQTIRDVGDFLSHLQAGEIKNTLGRALHFSESPGDPNAEHHYTTQPRAKPVVSQTRDFITSSVMGEGRTFRFVFHPVLSNNGRHGFLMTSARPGYDNGFVRKTQGDYEEALIQMKKDGYRVDAVFDLETEDERKGFSDFRHNRELRHIKVRHCPLPDMCVPNGRDFLKLITDIARYVFSKRNVLIFCKAGEGRSGFVATAALMAIKQYDFETALKHARNKNPHYVETRQQKKLLEVFSEVLDFVNRNETVDPRNIFKVMGVCLQTWSLLYKCCDTESAYETLKIPVTKHEKEYNQNEGELEGLTNNDFMDDFYNADYTRTCRDMVEVLKICHKLCDTLCDKNFKNDTSPDDIDRNQHKRKNLKLALFVRWNREHNPYFHNGDGKEKELLFHNHLTLKKYSEQKVYQAVWEELKTRFDKATWTWYHRD